jgi:aryl-alcohol dehydrogenase-like predicted oxidoreductase
VGWAGSDRDRDRDSLIAAFRSGVTHWDTADVYGDGLSERLIGEVWSEVPRDRIFLATKVGWNPGPHDHFYHPTWMRAQLERSLKQLQVDHIDLYYLHHCLFGEHESLFDDAMELLQRAREEGKVRFLGLSDWDTEKIMAYVDRADPDVVQPYRNVAADTWESSGLQAWVAKNDAGAAFFSPLRHGLLLGKYQEPAEFEEGDVRSSVEAFQDATLLDRLQSCTAAMRERFRDHPEPVLWGLLGALFEDSPTGCALVGQRSAAQSEAASACSEALSAKDAAWVRELFSEVTV